MLFYPPTGAVKRLVLTGACVLTFCAVSITSTAQTTTQPPVDGTQSTATGAMTIEQTLSDEGQRNTIAFSALSFLSGSLDADSFFPLAKSPTSGDFSICVTTILRRKVTIRIF